MIVARFSSRQGLLFWTIINPIIRMELIIPFLGMIIDGNAIILS